jgi:mannosyltransferase OCH1-like enzyme
MLSANIYELPFALNDNKWQLTKNIYDKCKKSEVKEKPSIPKIIHQIWLGGPFPEKYGNFRDTWLKNHPGWEYKLWTDKDIEELHLVNKKKYENGQNYGEKSDIARYEILYRFGGLYVDTDFECIKSFEQLHYTLDFYAGLVHEKDCIANNAIIGACPGHPILKICIDDLFYITNNSPDLLERTGPYFFTRCINKYLANDPAGVIIFPASYFYPWPSRHRKQNSRKEIESWFRQETLAVHHWYVSWAQ